VTTGAGDLLYLPPRWWHEVRTESLSVTLNASLFQSRADYVRENFSDFGNTLIGVADAVDNAEAGLEN
jgi:ribosomal protein L16 Arg81 hydroxylase